ncbi:hypothetical protein MYX65_10560 [Acidobacteria bacterium AH-259-L09]|nr:hypothetical protein [Acidobacteria bacterium AH-259-L09]
MKMKVADLTTDELKSLVAEAVEEIHPKRRDQESNNLLSNARLIAGMALMRQESPGAT